MRLNSVYDTKLNKCSFALCTAGLLLSLGLSACSNAPVALEPSAKSPKFIMEEHVPSSPVERSVTYVGKPEKRELAKLHLRYGNPRDEQGVTFDVNKHKRSIMAETPIASSEKTSTSFSLGAHKDHKFLTGITLKIRF